MANVQLLHFERETTGLNAGACYVPQHKITNSLIAVEVTPDNKIASITSRRNSCADDSGNFITEEELKKILGKDKYTKIFWNTVENH